jgi:N-acetylglucosaminyl-diphospho-decaprenol L-rhamnosyltransferase
MDVSICIVNWNTRELLCKCLDSIRRLTKGVRYETIVVDNASSDDSVETVRREFPEVRLIASTENLGFARGTNLAAKHGTGRYILYLNPDTEIVTDAISGMVRAMDSDPAIAAIGCRLLNTDGSIQYTCACDLPSPRNELCSLLGLDRVFPRVPFFSARELGYWSHDASRDVECLSGACMMLRRELVQRYGGLDESLFMYGEDVDLCARITRDGGRLHYLASEIIYHHEGSGSRKRGRDFAPIRQRAANYYFLTKHYGQGKALRYRAAVFIGSCARLAGVAAAAPALVMLGRQARERVALVLTRYGKLTLWATGLLRPA